MDGGCDRAGIVEARVADAGRTAMHRRRDAKPSAAADCCTASTVPPTSRCLGTSWTLQPQRERMVRMRSSFPSASSSSARRTLGSHGWRSPTNWLHRRPGARLGEPVAEVEKFLRQRARSEYSPQLTHWTTAAAKLGRRLEVASPGAATVSAARVPGRPVVAKPGDLVRCDAGARSGSGIPRCRR